MNLEQIIRPFAQRNTLSTRRIVASSTKSATQRALITWGASGSVPQPHEIKDTGEGFTTKSCDNNYDEWENEMEEVDVPIFEEGNDTPIGHVTVKRRKWMKLRKNNKDLDPNFNYVAYAVEAAQEELENEIHSGFVGSDCDNKLTFDNSDA